MTPKNLEQSNEQPDSETSGYPEDIGHYLRALRIKRGIDIKEAARETKISVSSLIAIEDHNYGALPADTFTRGLITIYGDYFGENGKALAELFIQGRSEASTTGGHHKKGASGKMIKPAKYAERTHVPPAVVACLVLLFVMIALFVLYNYTSWNPLRSTLSKPAPPSSPPASSSTAFPPPPPPQSRPAAAPGEDRITPSDLTPSDETKADETESENPEPTPEIDRPNAEQSEQPGAIETGLAPEQEGASNESAAISEVVNPVSAEASTSTQTISEDIPENTTVPKPIPATGPKYVLSLTFLKDTWVDVTSDNGPQIRHIADQGDRRIIEAEEWITLNFGKPESARIRLNGMEIDCPNTPDETGHVSLSIPKDILD